MDKDLEREIEREAQRNAAIHSMIKDFINTGDEDKGKIESANKALNALARWQSLRACEALSKLGLWGRVVRLLPEINYPDIEPTAKNILDFLKIEIDSVNKLLNKYNIEAPV